MSNILGLRLILWVALAGVAALAIAGGAFGRYVFPAQAATSTPIISNITSTTTDATATVMWQTDIGASSQVAYGTTTDYGTFSVLDNSFVTGHTVVLSSLTPNTLYHFYVISTSMGSTSTSTDMTFMTLVTPATSTPTSTPPTSTSTLQDQINDLQNQLNLLKARVDALVAGGGGGTSTPPSSTNASIDQNGQTVRAGTNTDFGGHGFGAEEHITVRLEGMPAGSAFTNLAGGFSTGSITVPSTPGNYTYTFTGQVTGAVASAVIHVIP